MLPPSVTTADQWPPDYVGVFMWRQQQLMRMRKDPRLLEGALAYYAQPEHAVDFICHWVDTYDPRKASQGLPARMPFVLFPRQAEMVEFIIQLIQGEQSGLIEKCRDMGATWVACAASVWAWRFWDGAAVGWGSRKEQLVDRLGDPDSIFEKLRIIVRYLPKEFMPPGFSEKDDMSYMRILNRSSGASITGEAGDNIGRGGRKLIYFKDESAHYEHPESIEAALGDNTRVQVDISSVNGIGNVFHRRREAGVEWEPGCELPKGRVSVFVMDWRDHPEKTQAWYEDRRNRALEEGLMHLFAQEVDRDYAASVEGVIIPVDWVNSAVDAAERLGFGPSGLQFGGLDVADEGLDRHAFARRQGPVLKSVEDWADGDTGETTRRVAASCLNEGTIDIQYDSVGVGAGVKAEANRLRASGEMPSYVSFTPWSAGAGVLHPDKHLNPHDKQTPLNKDYFANLKAQAWWQLRLRFERTHRAVTEGVKFDPDDMISIPSTLPKLQQLKKELSQATAGRTPTGLKLMVNKAPEGTRSPNLADAVVMAFWPAHTTRRVMISEAAMRRAMAGAR